MQDTKNGKNGKSTCKPSDVAGAVDLMFGQLRERTGCAAAAHRRHPSMISMAHR